MKRSAWLALLKEAESNDCAMLMSKSEPLQCLVLAWRNLFPAWDGDVELPAGLSPREQSETAWAACHIDWELLAEMSARPVGDCKGLHRQAVAMGCVYPDGTINQTASKIVQAVTAARLREIMK